MPPITFTGVSARSLGDFLKGYGLIAVIGERYPSAKFWWDSAAHLTAEIPFGSSEDEYQVLDCVRGLLSWADGPTQFEQVIKKSCDKRLPCPEHGNDYVKSGKKTCAYVLREGSNPLERPSDLDGLSASQAELAWAAAVPKSDWHGDFTETEPGGIFPSKGQEGRANYFSNLGKAKTIAQAQGDEALSWSLLRRGKAPVFTEQLDFSCGLLFSETITRYATGTQRWERAEVDGYALSGWCYLLAVRGALLLRGSLRRMRFARRNYAAFPFLFDGAQGREIHLPSWSRAYSRTLAELRLQFSQFQLRGDAIAANAAEFRAAVSGRGGAAGFDRFYRFVLEDRRPGQSKDQYLQQAIMRGVTFVKHQSAADVRLLVAPLAERGWLNRFRSKRQLGKKPKPEEVKRAACRRAIEDAIHAATDEPRPERFLGILEQIWQANLLLAQQAKDSDTNTPIAPSPPLEASAWERALKPLLDESSEHRIARAIGSILGVRGTQEANGQGATDRSEKDDARGGRDDQDQPRNKATGSLLSQLLPLDERRNWSKERGTDVVDWSGTAPYRDFTELLWRRWLHSAGSGLPHIALRSRRTAPLADIVRLLRGELDVKEIHRLVPLYALLDWGQKSEAGPSVKEGYQSVIAPAYTILRCWMHLAIYPPQDESGKRDGTVFRLLTTRRASSASRAVAIALRRLRIRGLPTRDGKDRPFGKSLADADVLVHQQQAELLPLAVLIPLSTHDVLVLADRLRVNSPE